MPDAIFGSTSPYSVFVVPCDADVARAVLRRLRIRPVDPAGVACRIDANGIVPGDAIIHRGTDALLFNVSVAGITKLRDAGLIDADRIIGAVG